MATFPGISLPNVGNNTVTVSVPSDGNNTNNSLLEDDGDSATDFSFITPRHSAASSCGFTPNATGFTGAFCGKVYGERVPGRDHAVRALIGRCRPCGPPENCRVAKPCTAWWLTPLPARMLGRSANYVMTAADINASTRYTFTCARNGARRRPPVGMAQSAS